MAVSSEDISAEQVRRFLTAAGYPFTAICPMKPPYPDVRVTMPSGIIAIETTEVHWGATATGSPIRRTEKAALRAGQIHTFSAHADPTPGVLRSIETKCAKAYGLKGDESEIWLLLCGGSPGAPASTIVFTPFLNLTRLTAHDALARSGFTSCYLYCELTERGPAIYGWDRGMGWRMIR